MNKEEYLSKSKSLDENISAMIKRKRHLRKLYIAENCPYRIGDKVKITCIRRKYDGTSDIKESFGFVKSIDVTDGNFIPECLCMKKDGTPHKRNKVFINPWGNFTVERIDK